MSCHFFAGVGGWPYALRLAGWPDERPVWTGSCPCQPYSSAGKGKGDQDDRNLWPDFFRLIRECRPECVIGEQVENAIGHGWLDGISADLEGEKYAVGSVVLGAHSAGAPHIRQRLYWVAKSNRERHNWRENSAGASRPVEHRQTETGFRDSWMAESRCGGVRGSGQQLGREASGVCGTARQQRVRPDNWNGGNIGSVADSENNGTPNDGWPEESDAERDGSTDGLANGESRHESWPRKPGQVIGRSDRGCGSDCGLANSNQPEFQRIASAGEQPVNECDGRTCERLGNANAQGHQGAGPGRGSPEVEGIGASAVDPRGAVATGGLEHPDVGGRRPQGYASIESGGSDRTNSWSDFYVIPCRDGKARRVGRGLFPLANGIPRELGPARTLLEGMEYSPKEIRRMLRRPRSLLALAGKCRTGRLKGYGNAIVPELAAEFVRAFMETCPTL